MSATLRRFVSNAAFHYTKRPASIEQVLRQVYRGDATNVDAELVESIRLPAQHPDAAEVFYQIISCNRRGLPSYLDDLLGQLHVPLLLLWGEKVQSIQLFILKLHLTAKIASPI